MSFVRGREAVMESSTFDTEEGEECGVRTTRTTVSSTVDAFEDEDTARIASRCVINASGIDSDLAQLLASSAASQESGTRTYYRSQNFRRGHGEVNMPCSPLPQVRK